MSWAGHAAGGQRRPDRYSVPRSIISTYIETLFCPGRTALQSTRSLFSTKKYLATETRSTAAELWVRLEAVEIKIGLGNAWSKKALLWCPDREKVKYTIKCPKVLPDIDIRFKGHNKCVNSFRIEKLRETSIFVRVFNTDNSELLPPPAFLNPMIKDSLLPLEE